MGKKHKKLPKRTYRAMLIRKCKAMLAKKKKMETSQDPAAGSADVQHVTTKNKVEFENNEEENEIVFKLEETEEKVENCDDTIKSEMYEFGSDVPRETQPNEENEIVFKLEETEEKVENCDDTIKSEMYEPGSDGSRETQPNKEVWVVRRQLCRGCHSDGAFWSLQSTTEGDTYGDLLKTYFNIQLCPVSQNEYALSAICSLCAARLRDARAFSAQAHAAEERFTRFHKQNRVRVLVNAVVIKKEVPKILNEVDDLVISDDDDPDTVNSAIDDPQESKEKLTKVSCDKPASKKLFHLSPSDYQRIGMSFKCTRCDKVFYKRGRIHDHVRNVHISPKHTCPRCDKTFKNLGAFNRHKINHSSINKEDSKIVYKLSPSDFERIGKSYKCTRCEKQYHSSYANLRNHVMFKHLKIPRYSCSHCDKTFHTSTTFNKHKLQEHSIDDRFKCNACDWFTYQSISKLTKHMNVFHMLGKKLTCPDCDYASFSKYDLRRHRVKHSTVKKHHCNYCKKSFLRKSNLVSHERIHTGDRRKVCNECGQAFVQRASLTYHMAKHHPEVKF